MSINEIDFWINLLLCFWATGGFIAVAMILWQIGRPGHWLNIIPVFVLSWYNVYVFNHYTRAEAREFRAMVEKGEIDK